ncbi:MAG: preprotein translocase subunit SecG [Kiritimatiellia bacterium]|jgi:preprotein translocase subunit SecG
MDILVRILMGLEAVICVMLIGIVLIQRSKGQGVGLSFGGGAEAVFGAQMGNVLTRTTVILAAIFIVNTTLLVVLRPKGRSRSVAERFAPVSAPVEAPVMSDEAAAALDLMNAEALADPVAEVPEEPAAPAAEVPAAPTEDAPASE